MATACTAEWVAKPRDVSRERQLAQALSIHPVLAAVLVSRGLNSPAAASAFLSPSLDSLHDPFELPDLAAAVDRLLAALEGGEPILVHGDYDADGVTSTALLVRFLTKLGGQVHYYLPHRFNDAYGLSERAVRAAANKVKIILAVDCGVRDHEVIAAAQQQGQEVIVVDHHEPAETLPPGALVIDPKREDSTYPERELAAVGLAFKLASAICERRDLPQRSLQRAFLDLVAIGTIADVAPLVGENRTLTHAGLQVLPHTRKVGLQVLLELCELHEPISARDVAFRIGPRINAVGRMADAHEALALLLADDETEARRTALHLESVNRQRQREQATTFGQAMEMVNAEVDLEGDRVILLARPGWHRGVLGIVAAKVLEATGLPAVMLSVEGEEARGSARSIPAFDIARALAQCDDVLLRYGGHALAAGLSVASERVDELRDRLNELGRAWIKEDDLRPRVHADCEVDFAEVDDDLAAGLARLEPCGEHNPQPLLVGRGARVIEARRVGADGKHLKLFLSAAGCHFEAIAFGHGQEMSWTQPGCELDMVFSPRMDDYGGLPRLQLVVEELKRAGEV